MKEKLSVLIYAKLDKLAWSGFDLAERLPIRPLRFIGSLILGIGGFILTTPVQFPLIILVTGVEMWEELEHRR